MPRSQFVETVTVPLGTAGALLPVSGISAIPYVINTDGTTGPEASAWASRTTNTPLTGAQLVTDNSGTVAFFLDDGNDYDVHFEDQQVPPRISPFIRAFHVPSQVIAAPPPPSGGGIGDLLAVNNLSDVQSVAASRTNLGLGTAAPKNVGDFLQAVNNGSDIPNATVFRQNIGAASSGGSTGPAPFGGQMNCQFSSGTKAIETVGLGWGLSRTPTGFAVAVYGDYGQPMSPYFKSLSSNGVTLGCYAQNSNSSNVSIMFVVIP